MSTTNTIIDKHEKLKTIFVLSGMISINAGLMIWLSTGITLPTDFGIALGVSLVTFISFGGFVAFKMSEKKFNMMMLYMFLILGTTCVFVPMTFNTLTTYNDDCKTLSEINSDVSRIGCIKYAINNPDATGAEIIEVLTTEHIQDTHDVLKRPLIP